jgi:hypothetical protein
MDRAPALVRRQRGNDGHFIFFASLKTRCGAASSAFESDFLALCLDGHVPGCALIDQTWRSVELQQSGGRLHRRRVDPIFAQVDCHG